MLQVKRADFVRRMRQITTIQGVTWKRRGDKKDKTTGEIIAAKGDLVVLWFIPNFDLVRGTKNFNPAGGHCFNAKTKAIANERLLTKQLADHRRQRDRWQQAAEQAVRRGDDDAARSALSRKAEHEKLTAALEDQSSAAENASRKLRRQVDALKVQLATARRKLVTLSARKQAADARRAMISSVGDVTVCDEAF